MPNLDEILRQVPYFTGLDPENLAALVATVRQRSVRAGQMILSEGAPCEGLHFVISGRVKAFKMSPEGREQVLRILGAGRTFNDVPVFDGGPSPGNVAAVEAAIVGLIPTDHVQQLVQSHGEVASAVIRVLAGRLRAVTDMVEDLALRGVTARVARLLLECSRGSPPLAEGPGNDCAHLTQQQLAAMTGSVREVVQRSLKALERDGAIALARGTIRVLDPNLLENWSGGAA